MVLVRKATEDGADDYGVGRVGRVQVRVTEEDLIRESSFAYRECWIDVSEGPETSGAVARDPVNIAPENNALPILS